MAKEKIEEMQEEKKVETKKSGIEVVNIATQTAPALQLPDGTIVSEIEFLAWMGNQLIEVKKAVA